MQKYKYKTIFYITECGTDFAIIIPNRILSNLNITKIDKKGEYLCTSTY